MLPVVGYLVGEPSPSATRRTPTHGSNAPPLAALSPHASAIPGGAMNGVGWFLSALLIVVLLFRGAWNALEPRARYRRLKASS